MKKIASAWRRTWLTMVLLCCALSVAVMAQRFYSRNGAAPNVPYDGRFTFVRVRYESTPEGFWAYPTWRHGYPIAEQNLMHIMKDICLLDAPAEDINVVALDDPELLKYPVAYIIEVGFWQMTDAEGVGLRRYLQKGGFLIVDDFKPTGWRGIAGGGWEHFAANIQRALPGARFFEMSPSDPIFHSFFEIRFLDDFPQAYNEGKPAFRGVYEDNDPHRRLLMIINYNTDVSQFWEWSPRGLRPVLDTNEAYKLGVNYLIYGLTH